MRRSRVALVVAGAALAACDRRPPAILICHNGNCAHGTDPFRDDTLAALDESLALEYMGRPAIDGIELDAIWERAGARCVFAHDLAHADGSLAADAAERVAAYLEGPREDVSWRGNDFFVKIEAKPTVDVDDTPADPAELASLRACLFAMYARLASAGATRGRDLTVGFESSVEFVRGLVTDPGWPGKEPRLGVHVRILTGVDSPGLRPADLASLRGDPSSPGVDVLSFHANRIPDGTSNAYHALGVKTMLWMLDATIETFYAIDSYAPDYINTNEAILFRRWLEQ